LFRRSARQVDIATGDVISFRGEDAPLVLMTTMKEQGEIVQMRCGKKGESGVDQKAFWKHCLGASARPGQPK
jgi:hypothetical protein